MDDPLQQQSTFKVAPVPSNIFEQELAKSTPHVRTNCDKFEPKSIITTLKSQQNPDIYPADITDPRICTWFEYLMPTKKFRCKFCNQLLRQGIISETKGSRLVALIMTDDQGYQDQIWAKTANSKLIREHLEETVFHIIAEDYYRLVDSCLHGKELEAKFERPDGPYQAHTQATENAVVHVLQCTRLDMKFQLKLLIIWT